MSKGFRIAYVLFFTLSIYISPSKETISRDETTNFITNPATESKTIIENALEVASEHQKEQLSIFQQDLQKMVNEVNDFH
jgi:UDP-glucose 4-epimerase